MSGARRSDESDYRPSHCPTCRCEPAGPLPEGVPVDPYCPEHGSEPTAYDDCSCRRKAEHEARAIREVSAALTDHPVTEYGTTRCPNEGWVAAEIDPDDGTCSACGEVVMPPTSTGGDDRG